MSIMQESFLNTLRSLRDKQLKQFDEDNQQDLHDTKVAALDAAADLRSSCNLGLDDLEDACSDFVSTMEAFNELRLARKELESKWNNIIIFAEGNL